MSMSDLSGTVGARVITDLESLAECRSIMYRRGDEVARVWEFKDERR